MTGELFINGKDAYTTWGMSLTDGAHAALMTPVPNKDVIVNKSRLRHGQQPIRSVMRKETRALSLPLHIVAKDCQDFLDKYDSFCEELAKGYIHITTYRRPDVEYKCSYVSCTPYTQHFDGLAVFTLKLTEDNPEDRTLELNV